MKEIDEDVFQLSKTEYEKARERATKNSGWVSTIGSVNYFVRKTRNGFDLYERSVDLNSDGGTYYMRYKNVSKKWIKEISGIEVD